jgi:hypothetical protein
MEMFYLLLYRSQDRWVRLRRLPVQAGLIGGEAPHGRDRLFNSFIA